MTPKAHDPHEDTMRVELPRLAPGVYVRDGERFAAATERSERYPIIPIDTTRRQAE